MRFPKERPTKDNHQSLIFFYQKEEKTGRPRNNDLSYTRRYKDKHERDSFPSSGPVHKGKTRKHTSKNL